MVNMNGAQYTVGQVVDLDGHAYRCVSVTEVSLGVWHCDLEPVDDPLTVVPPATFDALVRSLDEPAAALAELCDPQSPL